MTLDSNLICKHMQGILYTGAGHVGLWVKPWQTQDKLDVDGLQDQHDHMNAVSPRKV